jgi:serine/threonine protein kinase
MCWEKNPHLSKPGVLGSEPYIAPEMFQSIAYDAREVDVWACGIVYYCMLYQGIPWRVASPKDPHYVAYLEQRARSAYEPVQQLEEGCRQLLTRILEPDPSIRIVISEILCDPWFRSIGCCSAETETALATATQDLQQQTRQCNITSEGNDNGSTSSPIIVPPVTIPLTSPLPSPTLEGGRRILSPLGCPVDPETHHHIPEDVLCAHLTRARRCQPTPPH